MLAPITSAGVNTTIRREIRSCIKHPPAIPRSCLIPEPANASQVTASSLHLLHPTEGPESRVARLSGFIPSRAFCLVLLLYMVEQFLVQLRSTSDLRSIARSAILGLLSISTSFRLAHHIYESESLSAKRDYWV